MNKVIVRAPARADLAGGTLDLWPIYLFHPGSRTVNVAISFYAESEVVQTGDGAIEIHLTDEGYKRRYESMQELGSDPKAALIFRAVEGGKLLEEATALARKLATQPTRGLALIKRLLTASATNGLDEQLALEAQLQAEAGSTSDYREGVKAFLEKRPPVFTGR